MLAGLTLLILFVTFGAPIGVALWKHVLNDEDKHDHDCGCK